MPASMQLSGLHVAGVRGSRTACGDLSLDPGGVASVVAVGVKCAKALRVAARWNEGKNPDGFRCIQARHSMDQSAVQCMKPGTRRCHRNEQAIAFVARDPATASAPNLAPTPMQSVDQPSEAEALRDDDALPRPEED
jgi:hypothetical protein